ncbi:MAG: transcription antitermination factor NusB [Prosthecobacter sp.]|nr:transcription antitermination factor NusB [Prosthecobacter sp.]
MPKTSRPSANPVNVRSLALDVFHEWQKTPRFAVEILDDAVRRSVLSGPNAAFLHDIVLTTLRNVSLLDHWTDQLTDGKHLDHRTRWLARIGLCQLLLLGVPSHAAVNETVAAAGRSGSLVNAVLRRAARDESRLLSQVAALPLSVRHSHPEFLVKRWIKIMGKAKAEALCEWNQSPAPTYVRLNGLHEDAATRLPAVEGLAPSEANEGFFACETPPRDALKHGWCYAQDPSTAVAPRMLNPKPGETVLDACAAPGGKTALMAELMCNEGRIFACDASAARLTRLRDNLTRMRVRNAQVVHYDLLSGQPPPFGPIQFDRILLDVPCSNTGVMRRRVDVRWRLEEIHFAELAVTQIKLVEAALHLLKPGGSLVYSTCSIDPDENQHVLRAILAAHPELEMIESRLIFPPKEQMDGAYAARLVFKS